MLCSYSDLKRQYKPNREDETTEMQCTRQGFSFVPMVVEAHSGGFNPARISHQRFAGGDSGVRKAYAQMDELLQPDQLRDWVAAREEFE